MSHNQHTSAAEAIIARLPGADILGPKDIALAFNFRTTDPIIAAIEAGKLSPVIINGRYRISRADAVLFIRNCDYATLQMAAEDPRQPNLFGEAF